MTRTYTPKSELTLDDLMDLSWGWRPSVLLLQAHEAGVFDAVAGGWKSAEQVATIMGADRRAVYLMLLGLGGTGFMEKKGEMFRNAPVIERHLVRGAEDYRGNIIEYDKRAITNWVRIPEVVKSGKPIPKPDTTDEKAKQWQETFIKAMDDIACHHTENIYNVLAPEDGICMLDIGCGPATYIVDFLKRLPNMTAVAFDRPASEDVVADRVKRGGVADRVEFVGGDFLGDDLGYTDEFDLVLISQVIHIISKQQSMGLLQKAANAVKPGGVVAVHDMTVGPDNAPGPAAVFAIQMMLGTTDGTVYTADEIIEMMERAGLAMKSTERIDTRSELFIAKKG